VHLTPAVVEVGAPELIEVQAPADAVLSGDWLGRELHFFRGSSGRVWFALAGVDVQAEPGISELRIKEKLSNGETRDLSVAAKINTGHYKSGKLTVSPKFVEPPVEAMAEIKAEVELKKRVFGLSAEQPLWAGNFRAPVAAESTDSFGTRRTFNGKLASVHQGMDFRASTGTPVRAGNSGTVVLARKLYYEGNCVAIDHGLGLYTISMHLSRIDVAEGQQVQKGQQLGLSGATGRVTGPHLHWAVRWEGAYLDPAKLLKLDLARAR
jgi:murein DD-endopeptidase MepM/ murein hydrolase activator NlpD